MNTDIKEEKLEEIFLECSCFVKLEPDDIKAEPIDIKIEPVDIKTEPVDKNTEAQDNILFQSTSSLPRLSLQSDAPKFLNVLPKGNYNNKVTLHIDEHNNIIDIYANIDFHNGIHYLCNKCHKTFTTIGNLNNHARTHLINPIVECTLCKKILLKHSLPRHLNIHTREKQYQCNICSKIFTQKTHLTMHTMTHTGHKPHVCTKCNRGFIQLSHLRYHDKICKASPR
ncbi:putative zinc-finger containing protein [Namao virus]|nr:putative zinc-finger containing protein [Namao virus]